MIVQINGCNDIQLIPTEDDEVRVVTHEILLPYLPGIVQLHGLGRVKDRFVELDENWSGWPSHYHPVPKTTTIIAHSLSRELR